MNPDRFTRHGPEAYGIEANVGVDLCGPAGEVIAVPRAHADSDHPPPAPFPMPLLPARLIEDKVRLLRRLAVFGRLGLWALYIDTLQPHGWHAYLPPRGAAAEGFARTSPTPRSSF